jgi:hypothetical protein
MGLDDSRDITAMETGEQQHLVLLDNGYCDWRGQITRDPPIQKRAGDYPVSHCRWFAPDLLCWAEHRGDGVRLNSDLGHSATPGWPSNAAPITSTTFNRRAHFFSRGLQPWRYDGANWQPSASNSLTLFRPAFAATVGRRMCVAGMIGRDTIVDISRVDNDDVFSDDEPDGSENVLRAGFIDIANLLGTADRITGLGSFEQSRLAIFTQDRCFIYQIDPSIQAWQIEDRVNIHVGCASHNTIAQAGTDLLFCSRAGVHSVARSADNGITVFSQPMSDKVERTYRSLFRMVEDPQSISAVWDRDLRQYRIYFPLRTGQTRVLVMTMGTPDQAQELGNRITGNQIPRWSTGSAFNILTAASLGGNIAVGTRGGTYNVLEIDDTLGDSPTLTFATPIFWHGDLDNTKESTTLTIAASGYGVITIKAFDDEGRDLGNIISEVTQVDDDNSFPDIALRHQYQLKFERRYRGVQLHFTVEGRGIFRLAGIAIGLRQNGTGSR